MKKSNSGEIIVRILCFALGVLLTVSSTPSAKHKILTIISPELDFFITISSSVNY